MELIIKIPDEVYKTVQDGSYCGSLYEELKAAIPYEPSGDLISRSDALKAVDTRHEELLHHAEYLRKHCDIDLLGIKKHILAIPPVEAFTLEDMQNNFDLGAMSEAGKHDRLQGEWIKIDEEWYDYKCSVCGEKVRRLYPFCHCGADMRSKGGAEE